MPAGQREFRHHFQREKITLLLPYSFPDEAVKSLVTSLKAEKISLHIVTTDLEIFQKIEQQRFYEKVFNQAVRVF